MMNTKRHSYWMMLLISMAGAFFTAFVFVIALSLSLPPTDQAYHQGLATTFADPFVISIGSFGAFVSGLLVSPVLYFCLRGKRLSFVLPIVFGSTLASVVIFTPLSVPLGLFGSLAVSIASSVSCHFIRIPRFELI
jgi:hypothetical protein